MKNLLIAAAALALSAGATLAEPLRMGTEGAYPPYNFVNEKGEVVYKGDVVKQTEQALANMQKVLAAAGATVENLVKTTIIMQQDIDLRAAFGAWMTVWGNRPNPPTVTGLRVPGLANPDFLIEIEAQAVLP